MLKIGDKVTMNDKYRVSSKAESICGFVEESD